MINSKVANIIIAIENLGGGGAERIAIEIAKYWPREHAKPILLVSSITGELLREVPSDIEILQVGVPSSPRLTIAFLYRLRLLLKDKNILGVISHMTAMNRMIMRAKLTGIINAPVIVVEHNNLIKDLEIKNISSIRSKLLIAETGLLYRKSHAVVGCSKGVANQIGKIFKISPHKIHAIENSLDSRFLEKKNLDPSLAKWFDKLHHPIFISVGRMVAQKAFDDLIKAFALLPFGSLIILGDGPLREELNSLANSLGITNRVIMPGFLSSPQQLLQVADVYVSSSLWEGYPLTLIEAFASGLPIVARDCNFGPEEILKPDRPGVLVKTQKIQDLSDAMYKMSNSIKRFEPGTIVNLSENNPINLVNRYFKLF